jgi:hypothetical protein
MLRKSALEVEAWQFLQMAQFLVNRRHTLIHQNQQPKQKRPAPFGPGTSLFRYSDSNLKHPNVGTSGAETDHAPRRVPETG